MARARTLRRREHDVMFPGGSESFRYEGHYFDLVVHLKAHTTVHDERFMALLLCLTELPVSRRISAAPQGPVLVMCQASMLR